MSISALTERFPPANDGSGTRVFTAAHDGVVHNALGAASYVYAKELAKPLLRSLGLIPDSARFSPSPTANATQLSDKDQDAVSVSSDTDSGVSFAQGTSSSTLFIHIGAQPNNSPHAGTIVTFALAFLLGRLLQREYPRLRAHALSVSPQDAALWVDDLRVVVKLDLAYVGGEVRAEVGNQDDLMRMPAMRDAIRTIIRDRARIAPELAPERETLAHGVRNAYVADGDATTITFYCPAHGPYTLALENADDLARLELNTPLRNLARALVYMADSAASRVPGQAVPTRLHMRVTGADYAGFYQERLLFRQLFLLQRSAEPPMRDVIDFLLVFYAPLITDWSGVKLSKSLYVEHGAYKYLDERGMAYLLQYKTMVKEGKKREVLFSAVDDWVRNPAKLFCSYSIDYLHRLFVAEESVKGVLAGTHLNNDMLSARS
ncbi:hypothetical protein BD414DRAFT_530620 [Trametes punicea]|nr:hypothetical protein BD414DRAFT_530620 [Trametes punicea]